MGKTTWSKSLKESSQNYRWQHNKSKIQVCCRFTSCQLRTTDYERSLQLQCSKRRLLKINYYWKLKKLSWIWKWRKRRTHKTLSKREINHEITAKTFSLESKLWLWTRLSFKWFSWPFHHTKSRSCIELNRRFLNFNRWSKTTHRIN